ncbi:hypothetical protein HHI36_015247 [Cryptolaemus montrouzieri]|uniref:Uncharacterized protein n=1 Tax=Cryptolaemus montrouzieri TaxID=559131 RepID=A0ABD2N5J4_9CUCU
MGIPEIRDATGVRILGAQGVEDGFANFFSDLPPCNAQLKNIHLNIQEDTFSISSCSEEEFFGVIQRTSKKSSPGKDEIDGRVVRAVAAVVSVLVVYLINESFRAGIFPDALKSLKAFRFTRTRDLGRK